MTDLIDKDIDIKDAIWIPYLGKLSHHERIMSNMIIGKILKIMNIDIADEYKPTKLFVFGESNYLESFRKLLYPDYKYEIKKDKNKQKKLSSADTIRRENELKKINENITMLVMLLEVQKNRKYNILLNALLSTKYLECIIVIFIFILRQLKIHHDKISKREIYELIIGINKFSDYYKRKENTVSTVLNTSILDYVSETAITDMEKELNELFLVFPYNAREVFINYPDLQFDTQFDKIIPYETLQMKDTQEKVIRGVLDNINNGFLIYDRSPVGSGKTTIASIGIPTLLKYLPTDKKSREKRILVYNCSNSVVMKNVGRLAIGSGLGVGLAIKTGENNFQIEYNKTVKSGSVPCTLIIATTNEVVELIKNKNKDNKYIFYTDEITSNVSENLYKLRNPDRFEIFASASLPEIRRVKNITDNYSIKYPKTNIIEITSVNIKIGCNVKQYNGTDYYPHSGCETSDDIIKIINIVKENPFVRRMYEHKTLFVLYELMIKKGINEIPSFDDFIKSTRINMNDIINFSMNLLEILSKQNNDIIKDICKYENVEDNSNYNLEIINKFSDTTEEIYFIPVDDPVLQVKTDFSKLLEHIKDILHKLYPDVKNTNHYLTMMINDYFSEIDKIEKENKKKRDVKDVNDIINEAMNIKEIINPKFKFPEYLQIGTKDNYKHYNLDCNIMNFKRTIDFTNSHSSNESLFDFNLVTSVDNEIMMLLFCGIGIYSSKIKSFRYKNYIMELANEGKLSYLYTDLELSYGLNIPVTTVIIPEKSAEKKSIGYIFQTMGRVGREGKSVKASAFVSNIQIKDFMRYMKNPDLDEFNKEVVDMVRSLTL
jgi:hypothetical protein